MWACRECEHSSLKNARLGKFSALHSRPLQSSITRRLDTETLWPLWPFRNDYNDIRTFFKHALWSEFCSILTREDRWTKIPEKSDVSNQSIGRFLYTCGNTDVTYIQEFTNCFIYTQKWYLCTCFYYSTISFSLEEPKRTTDWETMDEGGDTLAGIRRLQSELPESW